MAIRLHEISAGIDSELRTVRTIQQAPVLHECKQVHKLLHHKWLRKGHSHDAQTHQAAEANFGSQIYVNIP